MHDNPFGLVYTTLWEMLLSHPGFERDVREGNRIRFDRNKIDPSKYEVQPGDLPEMMLTTATLDANLFDTTNSSRVTRTYSWNISTGDQRYYRDGVPLLADLEWYVFVAMHSWKDRLTLLKYNGLSFVKLMNLTQGSTGLSDPQKNRNITGWSAVWSCMVQMQFKHADLLAELRCPPHTES